MSDSLPLFMSGCACHDVSRRTFLTTGCAACAAGGFHIAFPGDARAENGTSVPAKTVDAKRIRVFFAMHAPVQRQPDWPNVGFDFRPVMNRVMNELNAAYDDLLFVSSMVNGDEATRLILGEDRSLDGTPGAIAGYLVMQLNCWNGCVSTALTSGKPVLYVDFQFGGSGRFLCGTAALLREAKYPNFGFIGSSVFDDVIAAAGCFRTVKVPGEFGDAVTAVRVARTPRPKPEITPDPVPLETIPIPRLIEEIRGMKLLAIGGMMGGHLVESTKSELGVDVLTMITRS
ncbi:MAG: twin-arginine translocation signal domain-containing protein [Planctomycetia bacterium]|nr:twin-arginine translocation signal domain-containing protein [Planctomycetia bacterium]